MTGEQLARIDVDLVWAGHPVGFCLLTAGNRQYVAYYDNERRMSVACRNLDDVRWEKALLPSAHEAPPGYRAAETSTLLGWDSHNSVTLALDAAGHIHLSGNMHCNALTYFRSQRPHDIHTFEQIFSMTGANETQCTYPRFLHALDGRLIFHYRDGSSGNGNEIYNRYDHHTRRWYRLLDLPLTDGKGLMNAYLQEPRLGPDGQFHLSWVWRDTPDCSTNHDLSYARSPDLVHWSRPDGMPLSLPITIDTLGLIVDPVPPQGGIINGNGKIGFDRRGRPILTYHKFDKRGYTQAYNARWEEDRWVRYQTSNWAHRWYFEGGGSINNEIDLGHVYRTISGDLALDFRHNHYGQGRWILDEETLIPRVVDEEYRPLPPALLECRSSFPGMDVRWQADQGSGPDPAYRFLLRWETIPPNRDRPRQGPLPEPSLLQLYHIPSLRS